MPIEIPAPDDVPRLGWKSYVGWVLGAIALATLIAVVVHLGELTQFVRILEQAKPIWLLPIFTAQVSTYGATAAVWWLAVRKMGYPTPLATLVPLSVAKLFTDQILPSGGLSGSVLMVYALRRRGVPRHVAIGALVVGLVSFNLAYLGLVLTSVILLSLHGKSNAETFPIVALFAVIVIAIPTGMLVLKRLGTKIDNPWIRRMPLVQIFLDSLAQAPTGVLRNGTFIAQTFVCQLAVIALDAATLWLAFRAIDLPVEPWVALVSFIMASVAATIGPIPFGLGTFEAAAVAGLGFLGVSIEPALIATLIFRGFSFWLPMAPGLWLARRETVRH